MHVSSARKKAIVASWGIAVTILASALALIVWSHRFDEKLFETMINVAPFLILISFLLAVLSLLLSGGKPILKMGKN